MEGRQPRYIKRHDKCRNSDEVGGVGQGEEMGGLPSVKVGEHCKKQNHSVY